MPYLSESIYPSHLRLGIEYFHLPWIWQTITRRSFIRPDKMLCEGHQHPLTTLSPVLSHRQEIPFQSRCKMCRLMRSTLGWHFPVATLLVLRAPTPMLLLINHHRGAQSFVLLITRRQSIPRQHPRVVKGRQRIGKTCRRLQVAK